MKPCIECGVPTEGSIGAAGIRWTVVCQSCKDKADLELAESIAAIAAAHDYVMPRVLKSFASGSAVEVLDGKDYCGAVSDCTCGKIGCPGRTEQPSPTTPEAA